MWELLPTSAVHYARAQLTYPLPELKTIEEQAKASKVPIVPPEVAAFLYTLVRLLRPRQVLEIGSGAAFSSLWMAAGLPENGHIYGLDRDYNRSVLARTNIELAQMQGRITIEQKDAASREGEAAMARRSPYDLVFIDCEKRVYPTLWRSCRELVAAGGVIVADNVLFRGLVAATEVLGRNASGTAALKEFLSLAQNDPLFTTHVLPLGDGLLVAIKEVTHG